MPAAPVSDGGQLVFDRNATQEGTAISHDNNSSVVTISQPGTYYAQYSATIAPVTGATFPLVNFTTLSLNGQTQSAGASQTTFTESGQTLQINSGLVFTVSSVPTTLSVVSSGGNFLYSDATINVFKV